MLSHAITDGNKRREESGFCAYGLLGTTRLDPHLELPLAERGPV